MELHLIEQVTQLLDEFLIGCRVGGVECVHRVHHFVRLFDQVLDQRSMRLLLIPRATFTQRSRESVQALHLTRDGVRQARNVETREMVRFVHTVEFLPGGTDESFVGETEMVQDHHFFVARGVFVGELDVGHHPLVVHLSDEQRSTFTGCLFDEAVSIDQLHTRIHGVDAKQCPRAIEEAHGRQCSHLHAVICEQQLHRALEDERRARHRVQHFAIAVGRFDQRLDDVSIHLVERST